MKKPRKKLQKKCELKKYINIYYYAMMKIQYMRLKKL